ncbi:MAG: SPFH domain-containing protein [Chloroflexi bacterium]|nr:SPFH domain-containing protein [Chloroflexota bacterium]
MQRPKPLVYFVVGSLVLILLRLALGVALSLPVEDAWPLIRRGAQVVLGVIILTVLYRNLYRTVPDGYAGVIWSNQRRSCAAFPPKDSVLVWPWDKLELYDLREKHLDLTLKCHTKDRISVSIKISLRWQVNYPELLAYLNMGIDGPKVLERLISEQLLHDVITRNLDEVQRDLPILTFHLERRLCWHPYGARMYGIIVQEPHITALVLPAGITALAEQLRQHTMERQLASHQRLIGYADRIIDAQARAHALLALDQVSDDLPRTVECAEVLELARRPANGCDPPNPPNAPKPPDEHK